MASRMTVTHHCRFLEVSIGSHVLALFVPSTAPRSLLSDSQLLPRDVASHSFPSPYHHHYNKLTWTEPVRYWRKAFLLACLNHIVP